MLLRLVLPIVAVQVAPEQPSGVLEGRLLDACSAGLRRAQCLPAQAVSEVPQAIAMVSWLGPTRVSIEVGLAHAEPPVWLARQLDFAASDPELERWRAVGFTIATLVDDERFWSALPEPALEEPAVQPPSPSWVMPLDAELRGLTGVGLVSGPWRLGAEVRLSALFSPLFFATVALGYAVAESDGVDVRWFDASLGVGVWSSLGPALEGRVRLEILAENLAVAARRGALGDSRDAWVPGVALGADLAWAIADPWALSARLDVFGLDGATAVTASGERVAASAGAGALVGLGGRYRF